MGVNQYVDLIIRLVGGHIHIAHNLIHRLFMERTGAPLRGIGQNIRVHPGTSLVALGAAVARAVLAPTHQCRSQFTGQRALTQTALPLQYHGVGQAAAVYQCRQLRLDFFIPEKVLKFHTCLYNLRNSSTLITNATAPYSSTSTG